MIFFPGMNSLVIQAPEKDQNWDAVTSDLEVISSAMTPAQQRDAMLILKAP
jgi:hypothetical protein